MQLRLGPPLVHQWSRTHNVLSKGGNVGAVGKMKKRNVLSWQYHVVYGRRQMGFEQRRRAKTRRTGKESASAGTVKVWLQYLQSV